MLYACALIIAVLVFALLFPAFAQLCLPFFQIRSLVRSPGSVRNVNHNFCANFSQDSVLSVRVLAGEPDEQTSEHENHCGRTRRITGQSQSGCHKYTGVATIYRDRQKLMHFATHSPERFTINTTGLKQKPIPHGTLLLFYTQTSSYPYLLQSQSYI
ncbi:hypothetical protein J3R30DRAFT_3419320 [Lentinula aciculospora]|uniref:Uncharacterized protein n=1 Tax=Lentinula aciculospora TaxID=153920 RepID=A0A9W9AWH8_9AGAR|nr:hypothetical protein J3R30DRAFT_3419320 [Lentinula aciculospora]